MGVYIKCPKCGEELNHDDEAYHLKKEGRVKLEVEFKDMEDRNE